MSQRIQENLSGHNNAAKDYVQSMTKKTGEYIDQFTTIHDFRTTDEILAKAPKCCIGHKPKPLKPLKLNPVTEKDTSRAKQQHQEQI